MSKSVVSALLYNPRGQVLLQHRDDNPYTVFPGHWGLFGGGVEESESLEEAIDREVWEELEYKNSTQRIVAHYKGSKGNLSYLSRAN
jgi:8-oxo-dGTP pyrophosphatase MutT (NUDIX family)